MANQETQQIDSIISSRRAMLAVGGAALAGFALSSAASAQSTSTITDNDILNFALNLEYLEAQFYSLAAFGVSIDKGSQAIPLAPNSSSLGAAGNLITKVGTNPSTFPAVTFANANIQAYAQETAIEEGKHVLFLQKVLGNLAVSMPQIDLYNSFNALGQAAIQSNFDPFGNGDAFFLLGAFIFEDTGVSAYHGAAGLITGKTTVLPAALGIHAVEAYHAGLVRTSINFLDAGSGTLNGITQKIAAVRTSLAGGSSSPYDTGIATVSVPLNGSTNVSATTIVDANIVGYGAASGATQGYSIAAGRTTTQILSIVTAGGSGNKGAFFPNGLNGNIK